MDMPFASTGDLVLWLALWAAIIVVALKVLAFLFWLGCWIFLEDPTEKWKREHPTL